MKMAFVVHWVSYSYIVAKKVMIVTIILQLPNNIVTTITEDISVGTILLPEDGELILQPSVTIQLSEEQECQGQQ